MGGGGCLELTLTFLAATLCLSPPAGAQPLTGTPAAPRVQVLYPNAAGRSIARYGRSARVYRKVRCGKCFHGLGGDSIERADRMSSRPRPHPIWEPFNGLGKGAKMSSRDFPAPGLWLKSSEDFESRTPPASGSHTSIGGPSRPWPTCSQRLRRSAWRRTLPGCPSC
jgi:hypothetical protein